MADVSAAGHEQQLVPYAPSVAGPGQVARLPAGWQASPAATGPGITGEGAGPGSREALLQERDQLKAALQGAEGQLQRRRRDSYSEQASPEVHSPSTCAGCACTAVWCHCPDLRNRHRQRPAAAFTALTVPTLLCCAQRQTPSSSQPRNCHLHGVTMSCSKVPFAFIPVPAAGD